MKKTQTKTARLGFLGRLKLMFLLFLFASRGISEAGLFDKQEDIFADVLTIEEFNNLLLEREGLSLPSFLGCAKTNRANSDRVKLPMKCELGELRYWVELVDLSNVGVNWSVLIESFDETKWWESTISETNHSVFAWGVEPRWKWVSEERDRKVVCVAAQINEPDEQAARPDLARSECIIAFSSNGIAMMRVLKLVVHDPGRFAFPPGSQNMRGSIERFMVFTTFVSQQINALGLRK